MATMLQGLQFYPGKSIVHRLDPRVKLFLSSALLITTLLYLEVTITTLIIAIEAILAIISGTMKRWIKTVYGAAPLVIAVFAMNYLVRSFSYGEFFSPTGLYESFALSLIHI